MNTTLRALAIGLLLSVCPAGVLAAASPSDSNVLSEEQWVMSIYQKGKQIYDSGDYAAATAEWDKLSGVVDRYPAFKTVIDYLRGRAKSIPPDSADRVEKQLAERQKEIDATFRRGKEFYDHGKMSEALAEWDKLASYLPEDATERRLIADLRKYYLESQQTPSTQGGPTELDSVEMQRFLAASGELFKAQAQQAKAAVEASENAQKTFDETYANAKLFYYGGNYLASVTEIDKLVPYLTPDSPERKSAESISRLYRQSMDEKTAAEQALAQKSVKVKLPPGFQKFSSELDEKFGADLNESETRRITAEKSLEDRQAWSSADFEKGAELYRQGHIDEAVRQWESIAPGLENENSVRTLIEAVKKNQAELARIRAEQEKTLADKQAQIDSRLEKGRLLFASGNFEQAKREWNSLKELVVEGEKLDEFIAQMQSIHEETLKNQKAADEAKAAMKARLKTPETLPAMLDVARQTMNERTSEARVEKTQAEATAAERQALVQKTVANGKMLADSGKLSEALKEWATLLGLVEDEAGLRRTLDALQSDYDAAVKAEKDAQLAESEKDLKVKLPGDLSTRLVEAGRQIRAQNDSAVSRRKQAEQTLVDRQTFVSEHFAKGKSLYDEGKFGDAFKEWSSLLPHLEGSENLKPLIEKADQEAQQLALVQKAAAESETLKDQKLKTPADLAKLLEQARSKLEADIEAATSRKNKADLSMSQRQTLVQNTFEKGKALYEEERYSDALKEWGAVLDELEDAEALRAMIGNIEARYQESIAAGKAAEEAEQASQAKLPTPPTMKTLLTEVEQKIASQVQNFASRKEAASKVLAERQAGIDRVFARGKLTLEEGDVPGALKSWSEMLPSLADEADLRAQIASIEAAREKLAETQKSATEAEERQISKITPPAEFEAMLKDVEAKLRGEISLANGRKEQVENAIEAKKTLVRNTFDKAKSLYDEKRYREALDEWGSVLPHLENEGAMRPLWEQVVKEHDALALAQKAASDAEARREQKVKAPESLTSFLQNMSDQLRIQTLEVKNRRDAAESARGLKQADIDKAVMRGNAFFREGKIDEAKAEWLSIAPNVEDEATLTSTVDALANIHEEQTALKKTEEETLQIPAQLFKVPSDISKELSDASQKLEARRSEAETSRRAAFEALARRQAEVQRVFDTGKKYYWDGKLADAIGAWASIAPLLEDSEIKKDIAVLAQGYDNLLKIQKETQEAELRRDNKLQTPSELPKLLGDMKQVVQSQTQYADTQKKIADQTYVDRQELISSTFQKGKKLYEQDRIPEALEEWASIAPYLEKGSELKQFIDGVAKKYEDSVVAKRAADEAELKKSIKFQTPPDLSKYLEEAADKMKAQAEDSQMQQEAAERSRHERQIWVDGKFERGKLLYQKGNVGGAIEEWKAILPYIEDGSKVRQLILKAEENQRLLEQQTASAASEVPAKILIPPALDKALVSVNEELEKSVTEKSRGKLEADVRDVIQDKKKRSRKEEAKQAKQAAAKPKVPLDEIEQMMLEYKIATPQELEKQHQEMKAVK